MQRSIFWSCCFHNVVPFLCNLPPGRTNQDTLSPSLVYMIYIFFKCIYDIYIYINTLTSYSRTGVVEHMFIHINVRGFGMIWPHSISIRSHDMRHMHVNSHQHHGIEVLRVDQCLDEDTYMVLKSAWSTSLQEWLSSWTCVECVLAPAAKVNYR